MRDEELRRVREANRAYHAAMAETYNQTQPYFSPENRERVSGILRTVRGESSAAALLDIGCGTGFILSLAEGVFDRRVGVDMTVEMLSEVPDDSGHSLAMAAAESLPFAEASFDAVTAYSVLHHIFDLAAVIGEIRRVLRPGGWFYADESPNALCARALRQLDTDCVLGEELEAERAAVLADHERYREKFGIPEQVVRAAMYRKYAFDGIDEDDLLEKLVAHGFEEIHFDYRWLLGGSGIVRAAGWEAEQELETHLRRLLPVSRHLFKYVQVLAR